MTTSKEYIGTCTVCGAKYQKLTIVDEQAHLCAECLDNEYFYCDECHEYWLWDTVESFLLKDGRTVCEHCAEDFDRVDFDNDRGCATYLFSNNDEPEKVYEESIPEEPKLTFKEKASNTLGSFGTVLFFIIRIIVAILPFVMIGGNFFLTLLLISINTFVPFASAVFWIWGLVCAIKGVQDIWAIIFYISFVLIWIPFFISTITPMFSKK